MLATKVMCGPSEIERWDSSSTSPQGRGLLSTSMDPNPNYGFLRATEAQDWRSRDWEEEAIERVARPNS